MMDESGPPRRNPHPEAYVGNGWIFDKKWIEERLDRLEESVDRVEKKVNIMSLRAGILTGKQAVINGLIIVVFTAVVGSIAAWAFARRDDNPTFERLIRLLEADHEEHLIQTRDKK